MSVILGYLFLSYGPRHASDVTRLSAAARQMRSLSEIAARQGAHLRVLGWDYARRIRGRNDLPQLFKLLEACREQAAQTGHGPKIIVDDYSRLFRVTEIDAREELWEVLTEYSDHFWGLRQGKALDALSPEMTLLIKCGALPHKRDRGSGKGASQAARSAQTEKARRASAVMRSAAGDQAARDLAASLGDYLKRNPGATVKAFLDTAEGRALRNSHGHPWSYRSALRVLRARKNTEEIGDRREGAG